MIEATAAPASQAPRVPIGVQSHDHTARLAGIPTPRFFTDARAFARSQALVTEYYGLDFLSHFWDVYNIEAEALGQAMAYPADGIPDVDRTRPLIADPPHLDGLTPPDPRQAGRMPWVLEVIRRLQDLTGRLDRVYFTAPFSLAVNIRGYERFITDVFQRPRFAHRLLAFLCDAVLAPFIGAMQEAAGRPDLVLDGRDAWASPPLVTLAMMEEFVVPYTARLRRHLGVRLITRGNWGDARSRDPERFFAQKLRCSPGALSVLDPDLQALGPERVAAFARRHGAAVAAGVDAGLLRDGPAEAVAARIRHYLDHLARDGRCQIHLNQIPADTPPDHVHAAVAACRAYGQRPLPEDPQARPLAMPQRESFQEFLRRQGPSGKL